MHLYRAQDVAWQQSILRHSKVRTTASTDAEVLGLVSGEDDLHSCG